MSNNREYITGRYYGLFDNGKLIETSCDLCSIIAVGVHNYCLRNKNAQVMTIDYIREDQAKQTDRDGVRLFEMTGQVDESFLKDEHLPMTVTKDMVKDAIKFKHYKRSLM